MMIFMFIYIPFAPFPGNFFWRLCIYIYLFIFIYGIVAESKAS